MRNPSLRLIASNDLSRFPREWRRNFAAGRIKFRELAGADARRRGDKEEEARHFLAAARIVP